MDSLAAQISLSLTIPETPETPELLNQNELVVDTPTSQLASASFEKVKAFLHRTF